MEDAADKAKYLGDLRVKFLAALEKEHSCSAPAKDYIPSARDQLVALWTSWIEAKNDEDGTGCHGGGGGDESRMTMTTQRELRLVELLLRRRSTAAREMDGTLLLRKSGISWAHGGE